MRNEWRKLGVFVLAMLLAGCGGHGPASPSNTVPTSTPDPCHVAPVHWDTWLWGGGNSYRGESESGWRLITAKRGVVRLTAEWYEEANNVDIYLVDYACKDLRDPLSCKTVFAKANEAATKPEVLQACVDAGTYWIWLVDHGPREGNGGYVRIELAPGTPRP